MNVIIILLLVGVLVSALFLGAFIWCIRTSQFEDDFSPAVRILFDDKVKSADNNEAINQSK
jgi:cbb3-type cytochrome oxidase maturation protein